MQLPRVFNSIAKIGVGTSGVLLLIFGGVLAAQFAPIPPAVQQGEEVTLTGELVDGFCFMRGEFRGVGHKTCSRRCAEAGSPIAFVDDASGEIYTLAGDGDYLGGHEGRDQLISRINETVTLTATLVDRGGARFLFVKSIAE